MSFLFYIHFGNKNKINIQKSIVYSNAICQKYTRRLNNALLYAVFGKPCCFSVLRISESENKSCLSAEIISKTQNKNIFFDIIVYMLEIIQDNVK